GAWRELAEALAARVGVVEDADEKAALMARQIDILWTRLGRLKEAFALESQLAEGEPTNVDRLYAMADRVDAAKGYGALLACAERSLKVATPDHIPRILKLIGRTARDHFGNLTRALETLGRALEIVPEVGVAREVAELLQTRRRYGDLVQVYRQFGPLVLAVGAEIETPALQARWALAVAGLEADQLFRLDDAIQTLRDLVEAQPTHVDGWERLRSLALRRKDGQALADGVIGMANASADGLRVSLLETGARDVARLGALDRAVDLYQRVLALAPDRPSALDALEALASSQRDVDLRADTLTRRASRAKTSEAKAGVYMELGALHRDGRGDPIAARTAYEAALASDPRNIDAMLALVPLVRGAGDEEALDELTGWLYEIWRRAKADATRRTVAEPVAELLMRRARQAADTGKGDAVIEWLSQAFKVAPQHAGVGQRYADALFQRGELAEAAAIYAQLPEPGGDDAESKAIEHLRRASAFVAADDVAAAMREYEGASHHAITRIAALTSMASLQQSAGRWEAAIRIQLRLADASADHYARHKAWVTAGGLALSHLQKSGRAVALFRRALADGLRDPALLWQMLPVFVDAGRAKEGLETVARLLVDEKQPSRRATLLGQRAQLLRRSGETNAAIEAWQAAAALAPIGLDVSAAMLDHLDDASDAQRRWILGHVEGAVKEVPAEKSRAVRARLAKIYEACGDDNAALAAYERLADATPDDQDVRASLASLTRARLDDAPDDAGLRMNAIRHQLALVRHDPEDVKALKALAALYDVAGIARLRAQPLIVLRWLRAATASEQGELKALRSAPPAFPDLAPQARMTLLAQDAWSQPAGTLLKALYGWLKSDLDAVFGGAPEGDPPDAIAVEDMPGETSDETGAGADWAQVKTALGFEAPTLLVVPGDRPAGLWRVEPLTLVIGAAHLIGSRRRRIFTLTRIAELARGPAILAHFAPEIEAHALYAAAVALSETAEATADFEADLDWTAEWIEFLEKHLDAGQREALARLAANVVMSGRSGFEEWSAAVRHAANHAGFVLAGDLGVAVDVLGDEIEALANVRPDSADRVRFMLARSPAIADLFAYAFGDRFHALSALLRSA
ncbi:MAG: tetratricopeptide (TPR) repeat protein, partial [Bradymonadia bacterium]